MCAELSVPAVREQRSRCGSRCGSSFSVEDPVGPAPIPVTLRRLAACRVAWSDVHNPPRASERPVTPFLTNRCCCTTTRHGSRRAAPADPRPGAAGRIRPGPTTPTASPGSARRTVGLHPGRFFPGVGPPHHGGGLPGPTDRRPTASPLARAGQHEHGEPPRAPWRWIRGPVAGQHGAGAGRKPSRGRNLDQSARARGRGAAASTGSGKPPGWRAAPTSGPARGLPTTPRGGQATAGSLPGGRRAPAACWC